jgi:glucosamine kinase
MRAVITDEEGRELGRGEAEGAVVGVDSPETVAGRAARAARRAAEVAGTSLPVSALWAGLAGAGRDAGRLATERELRAMGLAAEVVVGTDVEAAFHDAFGSGPGILLIAGTGSIAWGRGETGEVIRVGGWGEQLGDEGSGYAVGMAALRAVTRATDGRGPATALTEQVLEHFSLARPEDLIEWIATAGKGDVAALIPLVAAASASGDAVARVIMDDAVADLLTHVATVLDRAGPWAHPPELVLSGGLLESGGPVREGVERAASMHAVRPSARGVDPEMGAASLALQRLQPPRAGA